MTNPLCFSMDQMKHHLKFLFLGFLLCGALIALPDQPIQTPPCCLFLILQHFRCVVCKIWCLSRKARNKKCHCDHGNGTKKRISHKRAPQNDSEHPEPKRQSVATESKMMAVVNFARARFCLVSSAIKMDGPRHKHDSGNENRAEVLDQ